MLGAAAVALAVVDHGNATSHLDARLKSDATAQARSLDEYFARSRDIVLISAQNPALHAFNDAPGDVREKRLRATGTIAQVGAALTYLERLYPGTIGEACYIDRGGPEIARAVRGVLAAPRTLSNDESGSTFFHATFTGGLASVYQARPYRSPDTQDWVISNSTPVPGADGQPAAILHFEVALDSFRVRAAVSPFRVLVLDRATGAIVMDSRHRQLGSARLGEPPTNGTQTLAARAAGTGLASLDGRQDGFAAIAAAAGNANRWLVVSVAPTGTGFGIRDFEPSRSASCCSRSSPSPARGSRGAGRPRTRPPRRSRTRRRRRGAVRSRSCTPTSRGARPGSPSPRARWRSAHARATPRSARSVTPRRRSPPTPPPSPRRRSPRAPRRRPTASAPTPSSRTRWASSRSSRSAPPPRSRSSSPRSRPPRATPSRPSTAARSRSTTPRAPPRRPPGPSSRSPAPPAPSTPRSRRSPGRSPHRRAGPGRARVGCGDARGHARGHRGDRPVAADGRRAPDARRPVISRPARAVLGNCARIGAQTLARR